MRKNDNKVKLVGTIVEKMQFEHEVCGEGFYKTYMEISRWSEIKDCLPILVSERLLNPNEDLIGKKVQVEGEFRSFNQPQENSHNRLILNVFAKDIFVVDDSSEDVNIIILEEGFICKKPVYRQTPLGRKIADVLFAVNRYYGKSDYLPAISWGRNARYLSKAEVGDKFSLKGRIQSRKYRKGGPEGEERIAYEISIGDLNKLQ